MAQARPSSAASGNAVRNTPKATADAAAQSALARGSGWATPTAPAGSARRAASAEPASASRMPAAWVGRSESPVARPQVTGTIAPRAPIGAATASAPSSTAR